MKSKLNIKSILIIAIIGVLSLFFFNKSFAAVTGKVNVETANIRKETDANSTILEQASKGESVQVIEKNGDWYKVKYNGVEGYVRSDLVEVTENVAETNNTPVSENKEETKTETTENEKTTETSKEQETKQQNEEQTKQEEKTATENQNNSDTVEGMYTTTADVKLKLIPLLNGNDIKDVSKDTTINVLEVYNNWALAEVGIDRGWILFSKIQKVEDKTAEQENSQEEKNEENKEEKEQKEEEKKEEKTEVAVTETKMYVNWDVVNLREKPTTSSDTLGSLNKATEVTVIAKDGDWSKVKVNGKEGYIKSSLLSETKPEVVTSRSLEQERQPVQTQTQEAAAPAVQEQAPSETAPVASSGIGEQVCNYARQYLGCSYVYGGTTPNGFDCSGFTQYVFKHFGVTLNRTAEAQASNGTYVAKSDLRAGDLLIFTSHAGIYLGDGTFIHAANSRSGVIITSLYDSYYVRNYITARRIFN